MALRVVVARVAVSEPRLRTPALAPVDSFLVGTVGTAQRKLPIALLGEWYAFEMVGGPAQPRDRASRTADRS